ncbi:MAG: glycosyltransferase, partial [Dysgonamonadaceae bacterium]|nr:glycosyltransferase [Dysgonamonadaceae bacterium]
MKVVLVNKFYYRRGGDCIYTLNLEDALKKHGCQTAVFAMQHPDNQPTEWSRYFPSEVGFTGGGNKLKAARRILGDSEVKAKFSRLLDDFQPDAVHLNNIHSQLSPIVAEIAHNKGIKVVWTLHDYKLLCPRYDCMRNGKECSLCYSSK